MARLFGIRNINVKDSTYFNWGKAQINYYKSDKGRTFIMLTIWSRSLTSNIQLFIPKRMLYSFMIDILNSDMKLKPSKKYGGKIEYVSDYSLYDNQESVIERMKNKAKLAKICADKS